MAEEGKMNSLEVLKQNRNALLLAEIAALLHDWQKCIDGAVASFWRKSSTVAQSKRAVWQQRVKSKSLKPGDFDRSLARINVTLGGQSLDLKTLCQEGRDPSSAKQHSSWLVQRLGECHALAHVDKELGEQEQLDQACDRIATAFGFEPIEPQELLGPLLSTVNPLLQGLSLPNDRANVLAAIRGVFSNAWGDTRRPVNEVTLWDWGWAVSSLYKSLVAEQLLKRGHSHWHLLRVNFDVLGLYAKAVKIADLLGYQRAVDEACAAVKKLVEEEYPLGNEVYRDSTGIYFTFPDLDLPADLAQELRRRVEEVEPELAPRIAVTPGDGATAAEQLKGILAKAHKEALEALAWPFDTQNLSTCWGQQWKTVGKGNWELCPVCRLRPMQEGREACAHCERRRGSRIEAWEKDPHHTIWMDELADANGRVALLVGKFGLDDWLSGDLVQTMLVRAEPNNPAGCMPKNPSPARLRRVWETCQRFWTETVQSILDALPGRERWLLEVQGTDLPPQGVVCDGTLNGQPISVWRLNDALLTVSFVPEEPKTGQLHITWEDQRQKRLATYQVKDVKKPSADYLCYHPTLTLLASPDQFLALVPAADAVEIADKIRREYERRFGKVQNRLPLFLGLVFFPRKTPLLAVMDTARRMLDTPLPEESWTIAKDVSNGQVEFSNGSQWTMPTLMGDSKTPDEWYPYFFVDAVNPSHPTRRFQLRRQGGNDPQKVGSVSDRYADRWLVHVNDLKAGDQVYVTPSRFAYLFLESTAQRFRFDSQADMMLLDELPRLIKMWADLKQSGITDTGLHTVSALLETKQASWGSGQEFDRLVRTTLKEAGLLPDVVRPEDVQNGRFFRCLELYQHILKQKVH
jgi:hypothetical protein